MAVIRAAERPLTATTMPGLRAMTALDPEAGAGAVTLGVFELEPGVELPRHRHRIEEAFYVLDGQGTLTLNDATQAIAPGDAILAPAGAVHGFRSDPLAALRVLFMYPGVNPWTEFV
ncbi:MAG: cupin domain-containing protein [Actinobacteria bacterium]|nr:cupin domain-containing protein [Actinomycetota bacterium]